MKSNIYGYIADRVSKVVFDSMTLMAGPLSPPLEVIKRVEFNTDKGDYVFEISRRRAFRYISFIYRYQIHSTNTEFFPRYMYSPIIPSCCFSEHIFINSILNKYIESTHEEL